MRECLASGAFTAAVMMCRKILFHIAVSNGLSATDEKGRAPSFLSSVNHLQTAGIITSRMRPWVDRIKDFGNDANHEIHPIEMSVALDVAAFTEQLLKLTFEMDELMARNVAQPSA